MTSCTYGSETSVAALAKTVGLVYEVTSKPLTTAELKKGIAQAQKLSMSVVPYSGLGLPAYLLHVHQRRGLHSGDNRTKWQEGIWGLRVHEGRVEVRAGRSCQIGGETLIPSTVRL